MISFKTTIEESRLISRIVSRAVRVAGENDISVDVVALHMDLTACHANGCPIDFQKLIDAPDGDFGHDVFGIRRFIDRETGKLTDCFVPRCAKREAYAES